VTHLRIIHSPRAQQCKRCYQVLLEGTQPILWTVCDRCMPAEAWWRDAWAELLMIGILAAGCGLWVLAARWGWI